MATLVGIDIRATHVRAVLIATSYKKLVIGQMLEVDLSHVESLEHGLQACVLPLLQQADHVAAAIEGEYAFIHRVTLPATAAKQLDEILPFELEAQVPIDIDELVYDYHALRRRSASDPVIVITAAARIDTVKSRIDLVNRVLARELDRVGVGPLPLANLVAVSPELQGPQPVALIDLGGRRSEVAIVQAGEAVFARTLSRGIEGLPDSAPALAAELRQTFAAWVAQGGDAVGAAYLIGGGASAEGAESYLSYELGCAVHKLPRLSFDDLSPDQSEQLPRFAKAISLAMGLTGRASDPNLRRGELSYQRGYGFLKEKLPLLSGLAAAIIISFIFSTWAEMRSLGQQREVLEKALGTLSGNLLGEQTTDPEQATTLLEKARDLGEADPMPHMDAFDVIVEISKAIPMSVTHDIEEFDMQRGHVKVNGVVGSTADAQLIAAALGNQRCFDNVKISKITQVVNSDRQKYILEFEVKCPEDVGDKKKKKKLKETETSTVGGGE